MSMHNMDPIVVDPPDFNADAAWDECKQWVDDHGGLSNDNPRQMAAACGADPGCCACPACEAYYWMLGRRQRCRECGFEYPTDWWPMYSYGVSAGLSHLRRYHHDDRMKHPYYRYGFEHPVSDAWEESKRIDWRTAMGSEGKEGKA